MIDRATLKSESWFWLHHSDGHTVFRALWLVFHVKQASVAPLYSERNGITRPLVRAFGWRVFVTDVCKRCKW